MNGIVGGPLVCELNCCSPNNCYYCHLNRRKGRWIIIIIQSISVGKALNFFLLVCLDGCRDLSLLRSTRKENKEAPWTTTNNNYILLLSPNQFIGSLSIRKWFNSVCDLLVRWLLVWGGKQLKEWRCKGKGKIFTRMERMSGMESSCVLSLDVIYPNFPRPRVVGWVHILEIYGHIYGGYYIELYPTYVFKMES